MAASISLQEIQKGHEGHKGQEGQEGQEGHEGRKGGGSRIRELAFWLPSLAIITLFGVIGRWVYWVADDFCRGAESRDLGLLRMQAREYRGWSGRYTFNALIGVTTRLGLQSSHIAPPILAALSIGMFTAAAARLPESLIPKRYAPLYGALGCATLFGLYDNFGQSVLWLTGGLTYFVPFLFFAGALIAAFPRSNNATVARLSRGCALILIFLAVGCNEAIGALFVGCLVVSLLFGGSSIRKSMLAATLVSMMGFAVMAAAPGNAVRQSFIQRRPLLELPIPAATDTLRLFVWLVSQRTLLVGVALITGVSLGRRLGSRAGLGLASVAILFGLTYGIDLLCIIGTGERLVPRARIAVIAPMLVGLVLLSWFASGRWERVKPTKSLSKGRLLPMCAVSIFICALRSVVPAAAAAHNSSIVAERSTNRLVHSRGAQPPIGIPGPATIWGLANFSGDGDWALRCADSYFNVKGTYLNTDG